MAISRLGGGSSSFSPTGIVWENRAWTTLLAQSGSPTPGVGFNGWFYLDTDTNDLYGPATFDPSLFPSGGPWNWGSPLANTTVSATGPTNEAGDWYVWDENGDGSLYTLFEKKDTVDQFDVLVYDGESWRAETNKITGRDVYIDISSVDPTGGISTAEDTIRQLLEFKADKYVSFTYETGTAYTLSFDDFSKMVSLDNAATITLTVPAGTFAEGDVVALLQRGAGQVQVVGDVGVTVNTARTLNLRTQWSTATLVCIGSDEFLLTGDLEP